MRRDSYLYRHIRLDKNEPFYIGVGTNGKNKNFARAYSRYARNKHWQNIVAKTEYDVEIVLLNLTMLEARNKEIEFITLYGRREHGGTLVNLTAGGDGLREASKETIAKLSNSLKGNQYAKGLIHSEESKKKMSLSQMGRTVSEYSRKRTRETWTGKKHSQESIEKIREAAKGNKRWLGKSHSEETKAKLSRANIGKPSFWKGKKLPKEMIAKLSLSMIGKYVGDKNPFYGKTHSKETIEKIRAANRGRNPPNKGLLVDGKMVLNTVTGIYYRSIREAAISVPMNPTYLGQILNNKTKKKMDFIIV